MSNPVRIALFNHKGGVGKTTLTANIAFALAEMGKSVLLVDSDPQCIREDVAAVLREHGECLVPVGVADPNLGEVPSLAPLVQMAQREGVSTWECSSGTPAQRGAARRSFMHIANSVNAYTIRSSAGAAA